MVTNNRPGIRATPDWDRLAEEAIPTLLATAQSEASSPTWKAFLNNHVQDLVACDVFTVPTLTCQVLFVFIILAHERRRIVHVNITKHPTA